MKFICPNCKKIFEKNIRPSKKTLTFCSRLCSTSGKFNPFFGKIHKTSLKKKWSKQRSGKNNPCFGLFGKDHPHYGMKMPNWFSEQSSMRMKKYWAKQKGISINDLDKNKTEFQKYALIVHKLTRKQLKEIRLLKNYDKRGKAGIIGAYHLDHIYSIYKGFLNNIAPEKIANIQNLRMITWEENDSKGWK